jgi:hypothetical protein
LQRLEGLSDLIGSVVWPEKSVSSPTRDGQCSNRCCPRNALPPAGPTRTTAKSWKRSCGCWHRRAVAGPARLLRSLAHGRQPLLPLTSPGRARPAAGRDHPPCRCPRRAGLVGARRGRQRGLRPPARRRRTTPAERGGPQGASAQPQDEALGRSRGGQSSKLHLRVEGGGRPLVILVTAGQRQRLRCCQRCWMPGRSDGLARLVVLDGVGRASGPSGLSPARATRSRACGRSCAAGGSAR